LARKVEVDKAKKRRDHVSRLPVRTASSTGTAVKVSSGLPQASASSGLPRLPAASTSRTEKKADLFNRAKKSLKKSVSASKHGESGVESQKIPKKGGMKDLIAALLHRRQQGPAVEDVQAKEAAVIREDQVIQEAEAVKEVPVIEAFPVAPIAANEAQVGGEDPQRPQDNGSGPSGHAGEGEAQAQRFPSADFIDIFADWVRGAEVVNRKMIEIGLALPDGLNKRQVLQDAVRIGEQVMSARSSIDVAIGAMQMTVTGIEHAMVAAVRGLDMAERLLHRA